MAHWISYILFLFLHFFLRNTTLNVNNIDGFRDLFSSSRELKVIRKEHKKISKIRQGEIILYDARERRVPCVLTKKKKDMRALCFYRDMMLDQIKVVSRRTLCFHLFFCLILLFYKGRDIDECSAAVS